MTWRKTGVEFDDQCADVEMTDAAYRTHMEAIGYLYKTESQTGRITNSAIRRFATSSAAPAAIKELCDVGFWANRGSHYEVIHHAEVIAESLDAQTAKRDRDRAAKQRQRAKQAPKTEGGPEPDVSGGVSADTRQTDRQTSKHLGRRSMTTCEHGIPNGQTVEPWSDEQGQLVCSDCTRERKGA